MLKALKTMQNLRISAVLNIFDHTHKPVLQVGKFIKIALGIYKNIYLYINFVYDHW